MRDRANQKAALQTEIRTAMNQQLKKDHFDPLKKGAIQRPETFELGLTSWSLFISKTIAFSRVGCSLLQNFRVEDPLASSLLGLNFN